MRRNEKKRDTFFAAQPPLGVKTTDRTRETCVSLPLERDWNTQWNAQNTSR